MWAHQSMAQAVRLLDVLLNDVPVMIAWTCIYKRAGEV
jgi:hypothetical protein